MGMGNRGMALEAMINHTNEVYRQRGWAVVHKRPTPVAIVRTQGTRIVSAYLESKSTVDYEGVYRGRSLQFEAKSTRESTRFPLSNFHEHQITHMRACLDQGAIVFAIIEFARDNERLYVPGKLILTAWERWKAGGKASIPREDLEAQCYLIRSGRGVAVDYLAVVDKLVHQTA
ncbi:Holliday junction resolvase RecU [Alicyclobacillus contaminans]|uniref:Holliday junction resolvase RecU n=1 Tax=Alicyclobacillus contaminans TaxID=392016 RepID=UPI0003F56763|nr:Holliday junction resolvase RecU [Alicyclobacillus contaminans]GMA52040.1 Holliday junction resolvase RecU [Alicyclobacillus contaminans]